MDRNFLIAGTPEDITSALKTAKRILNVLEVFVFHVPNDRDIIMHTKEDPLSGCFCVDSPHRRSDYLNIVEIDPSSGNAEGSAGSPAGDSAEPKSCIFSIKSATDLPVGIMD